MTPCEHRLWEALRRKQLGLRARPQHIILGWIVDFYLAGANLVVEVDGDVHDLQQDDDARRTTALEQAGLRVFRVRNQRVSDELQAVLSEIAELVPPNRVTLSPLAPAPRGKGAGG